LSISTFGTKAQTGSETVLRKLEALTFFSAMMLAVILEGAVVDWMSGHSLVHATPDGSLNVVGEWTGFALPQGWLFGALLVLVYRVAAMLIPPRSWTDSEGMHNRRAFVRLWCLAMALVAMQGLLFLLGNVSASS
jgi:hypothetical protein